MFSKRNISKDLYFYYKNIARYILFLKISEKKFHQTQILKLDKISIYFELANIKDLSSASILSIYFFYKYYFGCLPYISKYKHKFHLNIDYYTFIMQYNFWNKKLYFPLYFFINDIFNMIDKKWFKLFINKNNLEYKLTDMNTFFETRNSLGFFYLTNFLNLQIFSNNILKLQYLLNIFKINIEGSLIDTPKNNIKKTKLI